MKKESDKEFFNIDFKKIGYSPKSNIVRTITEDNSGNLWIGTFNGIFILNKKSFEIKHLVHNIEDPYSISHNSIYSLLKDHQGAIWVGTYFGGVDYNNIELTNFKYYHESKNDLNNQVVGKMLEDEEKNIWIATHGGGLYFYNRNTKEYTNYNKESKSKFSVGNINNLYLDERGLLYIATHDEGLNILDTKTKKIFVFKHHSEDSTSINSNEVNCVVPYKDKYIIETATGPAIFNPKILTFLYPFNNNLFKEEKNNIFCAIYDSNGYIWLGSEKNGLYKYDIESNNVRVYKYSDLDKTSISSNSITHLFEDSNGRIWIGTNGGGLNIYNKETDSFIQYNFRNEGLQDDVICGITEDKRGNIWIATKNGLLFYDNIKDKFNSYQLGAYLKIKITTDRSFLLTSEGELFIGGHNGFISFNENSYLKTIEDVNILFTSLMIDNKVVKPEIGNKILDKELSFMDIIEIPSWAKIFSISFSSDNFLPIHRTKYQYQLIGLSDDWYDVDKYQTINFTGLSPKTYTLNVRAFDNVSQELLSQRQLTIRVLPPIYLRWYAFLFYIVAIVFVGRYLYKIRINRIKLENNLRVERIQKSHAEELNQTRMRFFTDISHEFRTPLTIIIGITEKILANTKYPKELYNMLNSVYNNSVRLNTLISELLNFRKLEVEGIQLKVQKIDINFFLENIYQSFKSYAQSQKIDFRHEVPKTETEHRLTSSDFMVEQSSQ